MSKVLYVSNALQAAIFSQVLSPEMIDGFWKGQRPAGHGDTWVGVEVKITEDGSLGPVGFDTPRMYNFLNPAFFDAATDKLMEAGKTVSEATTIQKIKSELSELSRIIGKRLTSTSATPVKLFRGNHRAGTETISSSKTRQSSAVMVEAAKKPIEKKAPGTKRTVVKMPNGATVTRAEVTSAFPFASVTTPEAVESEATESSSAE